MKDFSRCFSLYFYRKDAKLVTRQMAIAEGVTEQLKADNQMAWVGRMNNIRNQATEIINIEIIYTYDLSRSGSEIRLRLVFFVKLLLQVCRCFSRYPCADLFCIASPPVGGEDLNYEFVCGISSIASF